MEKITIDKSFLLSEFTISKEKDINISNIGIFTTLKYYFFKIIVVKKSLLVKYHTLYNISFFLLRAFRRQMKQKGGGRHFVFVLYLLFVFTIEKEP